eukprot:741357-Prymnesium_polylepis.1
MPCTESSSPGTTAVRYTDPNVGIVGVSASVERGPDRARFGRSDMQNTTARTQGEVRSQGIHGPSERTEEEDALKRARGMRGRAIRWE